jgi:hypothetical protein
MGVKKYFVLVFMLSLMILSEIIVISAANTQNSTIINKPNSKDIQVGLYLINLGKFDISTGSFTADFYLSLKCNGTCPSTNFEFMNGRAASFDKIVDKPDEKFYRIQANLNSPINLKKFPFDDQKMQIILEDKDLTTEELIYVPDLEQSGLDESIFITGWYIENWTAETKTHYYPVYDETYSQYVFTIPISRVIINSFFKTFLPIIFIILVMLSSFVLDPDKITTRLAMVGSSLVASVMFHVSMANQIPPVGYLTFVDKFMVLTYFVILLSFIFNVFLLELHERKKDVLLMKLHRYTEFTMFIVIPLLYIILFLFFL